jgi:type IV pilus assembly protein PilW
MHRHHQRGLSLISLMIALLIGTFLLAGLFAVWFQTRTTFKTQNQLAQVQDNQRMALIILANEVQTAGYYPVAANYGTSPPNPLYTQNNVFAVSTPFTIAGQAIWGTHSTSTPTNDTLEVRFLADPTQGNTLDCLGQPDTSRTLVTSTFQIDTTKNNLTCTTTNNGQTSTGVIVTGVSGLEVVYGVSTTHDNSVSEYMTADQVTANALWGYVQSVNLELTFVNPMYAQSGGVPGQSATLPVISRIVSLTQTAK